MNVTVVLLLVMGALAFWGFFGPRITGHDDYYMRKWRIVSVIALVFMIWIFLTSEGNWG